jgi:hypothetical protein
MKAFLETTAVVDLLFKDHKSREAVRSSLSGFEIKYSAQYVRMEIKRGVLQHFVYLHNKAVECDEMSEVKTAISKLSSTFHKNKLSTILEALANFWKEVERMPVPEGTAAIGKFTKAMLAALLRARIKRFWSKFDAIVDIVLDGTECYKREYPLKPPTLHGTVFDNTLSTCDKYKPNICRVKEFCQENLDSFADIHVHLSQLKGPDAETIKRRGALKDVLRTPNRDILRNTCWRLGDAIIILEALEGSTIINNNAKHYMGWLRLPDEYRRDIRHAVEDCADGTWRTRETSWVAYAFGIGKRGLPFAWVFRFFFPAS